MKKFFSVLLFIFTVSAVTAQWNYGSPFSTSAEQSTWQHVVSPIPTAGNFVLDSLTAPYPTNAWFNLFFLYGTTWPNPQGNLGQNNVFVNPYQVGLGNQYTGNANPKALLGVQYKPFQTVETGGAFPTVSWDNGQYLFFGTPDNIQNYTPTVLNNYNEISCMIKFYNTTNTNLYYYAPIIRGMPYVTMIYNNVTPAVYFPAPAIMEINNANAPPGSSFTGTSFKVKTNNGDPNGPFRSQTWTIYTSTSVTFTVSNAAGKVGLVSATPLTGYVRAAHVTYNNDPKASDTTARKTMLDAYAKFVPVRGDVQINVANSSSTTATMNYNFTRYNEASFGSNDSLLMMALPHHVDMLPAGSTTQTMNYVVMKGQMSEVKKKTWVMTENLPQYTWNPRQGTLTNVPLEWCDTIKKYALMDTVYFLPQNQWTDVYSAGKTLAKQGRIITICDELYERDNVRYASMQTTASNYRALLATSLGKWLNGNSSANNPAPNIRDSLMYDTRFKGLISSQSYNNMDNDFGSARYNDHHFHYGYYLYAAAVVGKKIPSFFTANGNYYLNRITELARDIANPSRDDNYFALQRYKDWYDGNSWANGLVPYGGGKNQESSSEAVNAWYGLYLLGIASGNDNMKYQGAVMLAQEIRAAQKYYHIKNTNPTYPSIYTNAFKTITNLYQGRIDASTFFGQVNYYSNGIQIVPITPATEQLWGDIAFCQTMYNFSPNGWSHTPCFDPGNTNVTAKQWATIGIGVQAMAYPDAALNFWPNYGYSNGNFDNGQSQTNSIHWILTRKYNTVGINVNPISNIIPEKFELKQNYPNPFNPSTTIEYNIPKASNVSLKIVDITGREVESLVNEKLTAGSYSSVFNSTNYSSGIYFYVLTAQGENVNFVKSMKMILLK